MRGPLARNNNLPKDWGPAGPAQVWRELQGPESTEPASHFPYHRAKPQWDAQPQGAVAVQQQWRSHAQQWCAQGRVHVPGGP
eukprot:8430368-Heterocapsa_arctica.AAC.1